MKRAGSLSGGQGTVLPKDWKRKVGCRARVLKRVGSERCRREGGILRLGKKTCSRRWHFSRRGRGLIHGRRKVWLQDGKG